MGRPVVVQRRPLLLAVAACTGVVTGHVLDALGLLPGVNEAAAVRAAALAPQYTALTIVGAGVLAVAADALLRRRRPWSAVLALIVGQTALLGLPEALAEATGTAGRQVAHGGGSTELAKLAVAVGLQVLLAAGTVGIAVLVDAFLAPLPRPLELLRVPDVRLQVFPSVELLASRIAGGVRGRGPPVPVFH